MTREKIISCMEKYAAGTIQPEDEQMLYEWLESATPAEFQELLDVAAVPPALKAYRTPSAANVADLRRRLTETAVPAKRFSLPWRRMAAAAVFAALLGSGIWLLTQRSYKAPVPLAETASVTPGGNKATLTLGDGTVISLDDAREGALTNQGSTRIIKLPGGKVAYNGHEPQAHEVYNTITTPKGGQYQIQLPDGTAVWLNAASSLRFPSAFGNGERLVELKGEGYFEVARDVQKPFRVQVRNAKVEVLGTRFNVNAYEEENAARTTLLQGAVKVVRGAESVLLRPGQQAGFSEGAPLTVREADTEQAVAWKNGYFQFDGTSLPVLARQIGRWYNVEVQFTGNIPEREFAGRIAREVSLQAVVDALKASGVNCRINGRTLEILP